MKALLGEIPIRGHLPVSIPGVAQVRRWHSARSHAMRPSDDLLRRLFSAPPEKVLIVLLAMLIGAAIYDIRYRKIPNWLTVGGVLLGFAINFGIGPPEGGVVFALAGLPRRIRHLHGAVRASRDGRGRCETDGRGRARWSDGSVGSAFSSTAIVGGIMALLLVAARGA